MKRQMIACAALVSALSATPVFAQGNACSGLPTHAELKAQLTQARSVANGGFNLDMWGTVVNRDGIVCAVAFTGESRGDQWPGSRVISAQKANTANAFSLPGFALSTANLWAAVQPGGSLFGLQESNPVDPGAAYKGPSANYGGVTDPSKTPSAYLLAQPGRHRTSNVYDTENFARRTASELTRAPPTRRTA